jgi:hypothetical protein
MKRTLLFAALSACMATSAWSNTNATATLGPTVVNVQGGSVNFSNDSVSGYVEHEVDNENYFQSNPFSVVPGSASESSPGVYGADGDASQGGTWSTGGFIDSGHGGFVSGTILESENLYIGPNTQLTLSSYVDATAFSDDPNVGIAVGYGYLELDTADGSSFNDQVQAAVFAPGSDHESGWVTVSYTTGDQGVDATLIREVVSTPFLYTAPVPEPSVWALMLGGIVGFVARRRARALAR